MPLSKIIYIKEALPELSGFDVDIRKISPSGLSVLDAVISVIIGQMLSRKAAQTIRERAFSEAQKQGKDTPAKLSHTELRSCGLSNNKIKAVHKFYQRYESDVDKYEGWKALNHEELVSAVDSEWGMSKWSASILAIFHFGMPDVYPIGDGTLIKAEKKLEEIGIDIDPNKARPYRSYLALYLWAIIDEGLI